MNLRTFQRRFFLSVSLFLMLFSLSGVAHACNPAINLEEQFSNDIVQDTKRIIIPEYPFAFNPSIVSWQGKNLMSFRVIPNRKERYTSYIGLIWLDSEYNPIGTPYILKTRESTNSAPSRAEDARLIVVDNTLYIVYSDNPRLKIDRGGFRVHIAKVDWNGEKFTFDTPKSLTEFYGKNDKLREKNWVPFDYNGSLLLAYSLTPHLIFEPNINMETCNRVATSVNDIRWAWGILRGGTPALLLENEKEYLAFFHSSKPMTSIHSDQRTALHYFIGAYTFSNTPPFNITRISSQPIVGNGFYTGETYAPYWHPVKAVFPCGYVMDEDSIWISYGRDDHEIWIARLDKEALFKNMIPVASLAIDPLLEAQPNS